jgi:hypothetical protein
MNAPDENDRRLAEEKACSAVLLNRWRRELLIDETQGDADAVEFDRRVLDYYLDQYNRLAGSTATRETQGETSIPEQGLAKS